MKYSIEQLAPEYLADYAACKAINPFQVQRYAGLFSNVKSQYLAASLATGVPDYMIFLLHHMEGDCDFKTHLHNGDPLSARTVDDPEGRPPHIDGDPLSDPPFAFTYSAIDALRFDGLDQVRQWDVPTIAFFLEKYNGFGYREYHQAGGDPYLWGGSQFYKFGKYTADGKFDPAALSDQIGGMLILRQLCDSHLVSLPAYPAKPQPAPLSA